MCNPCALAATATKVQRAIHLVIVQCIGQFSRDSTMERQSFHILCLSLHGLGEVDTDFLEVFSHLVYDKLL